MNKNKSIEVVTRKLKKKTNSLFHQLKHELINGFIDSIMVNTNLYVLCLILIYVIVVMISILTSNSILIYTYIIYVIEVNPFVQGMYEIKKYIIRLLVSRLLFIILFENIEDWLFIGLLPIMIGLYLITPHLMMVDYGYQDRIEYVFSRFPYFTGYYMLLSVFTYLYLYTNQYGYEYIIACILLINTNSSNIGVDKYTKFNGIVKYAKYIPYSYTTFKTDIIDIIESLI